jgi:hypothetical protein
LAGTVAASELKEQEAHNHRYNDDGQAKDDSTPTRFPSSLLNEKLGGVGALIGYFVFGWRDNHRDSLLALRVLSNVT